MAHPWSLAACGLLPELKRVLQLVIIDRRPNDAGMFRQLGVPFHTRNY